MGQSHPKHMVDLSEKCEKEGIKFHEEKKKINGSMRNVVSWLPAEGEVKAIVFISHGYIEHSLSYYKLAHRLVESGYAVYAMDHVGHGSSDGRRGVVPDYRVLYSDYIDFANSIRSNYPDLPAFLLGHSMGGLIAIMSVNGIKNLTAMILSAPALVAGPAGASPFGCRCLYTLGRTAFAACLTSVMSVIDPAGAAAPIHPEDVTSDREILKELKEDPRRNAGFVTNKAGRELLRMIKVGYEEIPRITIPFLIFHGSKDEVVYEEGSEYFFKNAGTDITQRRIHIFEGALHEVLNEVEPYRTEAANMIVDYFNEQCDSIVP
jgi:acylglycerol lipase